MKSAGPVQATVGRAVLLEVGARAAVIDALPAGQDEG